MTVKYCAGTKWLPEHVNILLEEYQKDPSRYIKNAIPRLHRNRSSVVKFIQRSGGIQAVFSRGGY